MKNSRDGKSYSTNLAFTPPEYLRTGNTMLTDKLCTDCNGLSMLFMYIYVYWGKGYVNLALGTFGTHATCIAVSFS